MQQGESYKGKIWEKLTAFIDRHRRFHEQKWALPEGQIATLEAVANLLKPTDIFFANQKLFNEKEVDFCKNLMKNYNL